MKLPRFGKFLSIIDPETNLHTYEYYQKRLLQEKTRVERSHNPLSVLIINLHYRKNAKVNGKLLSKFIKRIHLISRSTDIKSWYQDDKIAILMPDTDKQGALILADKLSQEIKNITNGQFLKRAISFKVFTYGESNASSASYARSPSNLAQKNVHKKMDFYKADWKPLYQDDIAVLSHFDFLDMLSESTKLKSIPFQKGVKKSIDFLGSLIGIMIISPLLVMIAVLVKLTSPGPVFFKQERVGYRGKKFTFLKFRSMHANTDENLHRNYVVNLINQENAQQQSWSKLDNDPRITKIGKFLRKGSMDELPQLFNVLKGEMSLVGPRPPIPYEVEKYQLWQLKRIMEVKPGITGLWQIRGRGETTFNDMVRLDLSYLNNWSLWLDIKILLKTFLVVFSTKGAE